MNKGTSYTIEVRPKIPPRLKRLEEIANNLWYSWDKPARTLFARLHEGLWDAVAHNPKAFLKRVDESRLLKAADDPVFLGNFNRVLSVFDTYHKEPLRRDGSEWLRGNDLVAYFCFEFGFHESFPIYSGGLGILAGDYCKAASDMRLPFIAVTLLYRQGYFTQTIDNEGNQRAIYTDSNFDDLPIETVRDEGARELRVQVPLPGRNVAIKVWEARIGHVSMILLDTDLEENSEHDRDIVHRLYGGDRMMRIEQEIVLGLGGVRALRAMKKNPTVWHMNEGHAAFLVLERMRHLVAEGLSFSAALEAVAVNTVFTTHTAVPAGHDSFPDSMMLQYLDEYLRELKVDTGELLALGHTAGNSEFNMTALAIRGSRFHNAVSRIHCGVTSRMLAELWPQVHPEENPIGYVTNGVHVPTFLAHEWHEVFDRFLGYDWSNRLSDVEFWKRIDEIPDHLFWSLRQTLKAQMFYTIRARIAAQHFRNNGSEAHLDRLLKLANPTNLNVLTIGFARRFATYKRATLLFENLDLLRKIISDRPMLLIFAGKAHPADVPGQDLIRRVHAIARDPEFEGRLLLVEGHDLGLTRRLVAGVDVWLNNPISPLEACGTSGMKAGINGTLNLSVTDGWWAEAYDGRNGWAIKPASESLDMAWRQREEAKTLYEILQDQVIPLYFDQGKTGYSEGWVKMAKYSIATLLPRYNSTRMVNEYLKSFYLPATRQYATYSQNERENAKLIAQWKARIRARWSGVKIRRLDDPQRSIVFGEGVRFEVAVDLNGLRPEDVVVELLIGRETKKHNLSTFLRHNFEFQGVVQGGEHRFAMALTPEMCGKLEYRVRVFPWHQLLTNPLEMGMMLWL
jgi:starch phosphorylase